MRNEAALPGRRPSFLRGLTGYGLVAGLAGLFLLVSGCASGQPAAARAEEPAPVRPALAAAAEPDTTFIASEEASGAAEFIRLVRESMRDGAWFEATGYLDSAMLQLVMLEASENLTDGQLAAVKAWQDTVRGWMVEAARQSALHGGAENLAEYIDYEIEEVSLASLEDLEALLPRLPDRNFEIPIPSPIPHEVLQAMRVFTGSGRDYFERWLRRRGRYEELILSKLEERGMPRDLLYLSMIESGFNPKAWSHASASGLWQFISGTGRRYGLQNDWWEDARRDPVRATDAALDYLEDLYAEFGDWHLAMAAYNCGEGRVRRHLRAGIESYWGMPLPRETRYYVPKILAAMIIGRNPAVFGFGDVVAEAHPPLRHDTLTINRALSVRDIAAVVGVDPDSIKALNPALRRNSTPPNRSSYVLYLPEGTREAMLQGLDRLQTVPAVSLRAHRVARGQTLSGIAARYGVSVAAIQSANGMRGTLLRAGQTLTIPVPGGSDDPDTDLANDKPVVSASARRHTVLPGETLSGIASRYRVTVSGIRRANAMRPGEILKAGRVLAIPGPSRPVADEPRVARAPANTGVHVVKQGETLSAIAARYGVRVSDLRSWNGLSGSNIRVGQRLAVRGNATRVASASGSEYYKVRRGDNLWAISNRFGSTVDELMRINDGLSEDLRPGQRIRVR